jgi:predicted permease
MYAWGPITVEGQALPPGENFINADQRIVAGDYFPAMQIPLLRGRLFTENDNATTPKVVVIDDYMAAQFWPGQDPIGKRVRLGPVASDAPLVTIVGVVSRVKQYTLDSDSRIALYLPHLQFPSRELNVVVRTSSDPSLQAGAVTQAIHDLDPGLPVYSVRSMQQRVADSLARRRFAMGLLAFFAAVSLALAALGTFAVIAYLVNQGLPEIGIRIALGATRLHILSMIVRRGMMLTTAGVAAGLICAFLLSRFIQSLLFGVVPHDPATYLAVALVLLCVSLLATSIPAGRAARTDPVTCLRNE